MVLRHSCYICFWGQHTIWNCFSHFFSATFSNWKFYLANNVCGRKYLSLNSCFLSKCCSPEQVLFHALTGKWILLIYSCNADNDKMQSVLKIAMNIVEIVCIQNQFVHPGKTVCINFSGLMTNKQKIFSIV